MGDLRGKPPLLIKADVSPARMDVLQSLSGLVLVVFVWSHMFFESSILLGKDAMYWVTKMFEGEHLFGDSYPWLVSAAAAIIFLLIALHAILAMRKFPGNTRQYTVFHRHMGTLRHSDTTLWYVQVVTGFSLFFLVPVHLYSVFTQPENIGPYASSDRVWTERFWILYALLLVAVHVHAGIGIYRLALKWWPLSGRNISVARARLKVAMWCIIVFFTTLGTTSLVVYMRIGFDHADRAGERFVPVEEDQKADN